MPCRETDTYAEAHFTNDLLKISECPPAESMIFTRQARVEQAGRQLEEKHMQQTS